MRPAQKCTIWRHAEACPAVLVLALQSCFAPVALTQEVRANARVDVKAQFEIASIKLHPWTNQGRVGVFTAGNTLTAEHVDLYRLVEFAYGLPPDSYQLSGGPGWARRGTLDNVSGAESLLFQVTAKATAGARPTEEAFRLMLQALLADRFQLRVRREMKRVPVFNLVIARDGPKLKESAADTKESLRLRAGRLFRMSATHVTLAVLVEQLVNSRYGVARPVFDRTGLTGFYDFEIEWAIDNPATFASDTVLDIAGPSVFAAVQQLGLKMDSGAEPLETFVIAHAEKPSEN